MSHIFNCTIVVFSKRETIFLRRHGILFGILFTFVFPVVGLFIGYFLRLFFCRNDTFEQGRDS
jgi:hypothetical protein